MNMKKIRLGDYISLITDYHSGGSYQTLKEKTKILHKPDYAVYVRTINFENNNFDSDLVYCDESSYNFLEYSHVKENDILMNKIANPGSVYLMPKVSYKATCGLNLFLIRLNGISQRYMYYVMKHNESYIKRQAHGTSTKTITKDEVRDLSFYIHDKPEEQEKVEKTLNYIAQRISLIRNINKELEAMAKELYDYWFVQFDFPNQGGKPYKSSGGKMVYNEVLKREIPDGWEVKKISSQIKENIGGDWGKEKPEGNYQLKVSCCRGADIVSMTDLPTRYILNANSSKLLKEDDIIIEISGGSPTQATGRCVLISKEILNSFDNKLICSNFCQALSIADKDYISYFYHMWKMFYDSDVFFNYEGKTSGIKNFQYDTFVTEKWYFPPKDLAIKFGEIVSKNYKKKCELELENKRLAALRDELLPMLMNGQVSVK